MKPFSHSRLIHTRDLGQVAFSPDTRFLAGGTNLVDLMKHQIECPDRLIDLSAWLEGSQVQASDNEFKIGAQVTNTELANFAFRHPSIAVLCQALLSGATVQLRNRATTAGNLLQRTRCYYFYDTHKACNKRAPGSGCAARQGFNRIHAILGTSEHCIASHPSDMAVAMTALDAQIHTIDTRGESRQIPVRELYRLPEDTPHLETVLETGELITHVTLANRPRGTQIYRKVRDRASYAFALVSVACALKLKDGIVDHISLAFGGVGTRPWHASKAEAFLLGKSATPSLFEQAASLELDVARGYGDNDFKIPMLTRTVQHVLSQAAAHQQAHPEHEGAMYVR